MTPEERIEASRDGLVAGARYTEQTFRDVARAAITVKLTPEILACMGNSVTPLRARQRATAMFRAAGFIVEEL